MSGQSKGFLTIVRGEHSYADVTPVLRMNEGAVRVAAHRLRKRYRQMLRHEIAQTITDRARVEEEMRALFESFRG